MDSGIAYRAQIGLVVLSSDQTLSYEARKMLDIPGIAFFESRLYFESVMTADNLAAMQDRIPDSVRLINSIYAPDVVAYGCTSGAMIIGHDAIAIKVRGVFPDAKVTDPLLGMLASLKALGTRRVGLVSPYPQAMTEQMARYLRAEGFEVPVVGSFHQDGVNTTRAAPLMSPESNAAAILEIGRSDRVDTVFLACTSMRAADILESVEGQLGKPVTTSNHALSWHALRLAGCDDEIPGWGRLFRMPMSP